MFSYNWTFIRYTIEKVKSNNLENTVTQFQESENIESAQHLKPQIILQKCSTSPDFDDPFFKNYQYNDYNNYIDYSDADLAQFKDISDAELDRIAEELGLEKEEIVASYAPSWQFTPQFGYANTNFYFLMSNFYDYNTHFIGTCSIANSNLSGYSTFGNEIAMLPRSYQHFKLNNNFLDEYAFLRRSSFINFFINNFVDVPICFKKSKSLKTKNAELPLLKLSNLLMKQGKREKAVRHLFQSVRALYINFKNEKINAISQSLEWINACWPILNTFSMMLANEQSMFNLSYIDNLELNYKNFNTPFGRLISTDFFVKTYFLTILSKVSPVFSYFIYSVDKNVRKFSRGKSGKYTFVWKYIAPYKRLQLSLRWLVKDIKFFQSKKFSDRLFKSFVNLVLQVDTSFAWKSKIFSHNYVFKNFRKTLMTSLKATT